MPQYKYLPVINHGILTFEVISMNEEQVVAVSGNGKGQKKPRILNSLRRECLACFEQGMGYKSTAKKLGLKIYTVREYRRRYNRGDLSWVERGRKE